MNVYEPLVTLKRGELTECVFYGHISAVGQETFFAAGDWEHAAFYRSASKPIQAMPVVYLGLKDKYGITEEELALMCGSQRCEMYHIPFIESLMEKARVRDEDLIMLPAFPLHQETRDEMIRMGMKKKKIYHNCIGKHIACILIQRELGGAEKDYYKPDSAAQRHILSLIADMAGTYEEEVKVGVDGCGVPVFGVKGKEIARSFLKLAANDMILNPEIREAAGTCCQAIHKAPRLFSAKGHFDTVIHEDENIICKGGALGVQCFALRDERLGFFIKLSDGSYDVLPLLVLHLLEEISYKNKETIKLLKERYPFAVKNDCNAVVADYHITLKLKDYEVT